MRAGIGPKWLRRDYLGDRLRGYRLIRRRRGSLAVGQFGAALHAAIVPHQTRSGLSDMMLPYGGQMAEVGLPSPFAEAVLDLVAGIPKGKAVAYGQIAEMLGEGGPRQVAHTMSHFGSGVPWWRVVRADGTPAPEVRVEALRRLALDRTPLNGSGDRVDWSRARWRGRAT